MKPLIFHIDVNSAYLSWTAIERLKNFPEEPDIRLIPSIIGGDQNTRHGIVLAKSIPAKKFGIYTSEPVISALRKCPNLKMIPPDHKLYAEKSRALMTYLRSLTPDIEQVSIDECYMDFTGISHKYPSALEAAHQIKDTIRQTFGFTVNIGISNRKVLAKMASDLEKPDKVHTLFPEELKEKIWHLPVSDLHMAGHSSVEILKKLEILTIGDLAAADPDLLSIHLKSHGRLLWEYANGIDDTPVESSPSRLKGVGNSTTLPKDIKDASEAKKILRMLSEKVAERLRKDHSCAGSVCVEIKYATFQKVSHQMQLSFPTQNGTTLFEASCFLFDALWNHSPIRLLGIRTGKLSAPDEPVQMSIFDLSTADKIKPRTQKQKQLDEALDKIRKKYGKESIRRGDEI